MRIIIQRVTKASVTIEGTVSGEISKGLLLLVGIVDDDTNEDIEWLVRKIVQMRIFEDAEGKMNASLRDVNGRILLVSQFTLHASTKKGNRPSFTAAARPEVAIPLYESLIKRFEVVLEHPIETGRFGADMKVCLLNDGPVTILMDSKNRE